MKIFDRAIDESGKADKNSIEIHADFKRQYLLDVIKEKRHEDVITSEKIVKKDMFYNEENQKQIDDLSKLLLPEQFVEIKKRLKDAGTRTGFACIFSGPAGTGKTETVLQIAKETGRDIIKVDMSSLRSKWWGEDEKNVKGIFSNYKSVLQDSKLEPILLLNEADAIIGKRLDVTGNNGAIITSINAVQNIILEELENFEGILIATTNLTQNMDSAFERRFLYKITFEKPTIENKIKLWESIVKINEIDAKTLANQFDFTGAQIENIFRKKTANSILYGDSYDLNKLIDLCKEEKIDKTTRIGFGS
jgi:SpoVK/Ycf46/Vps4 family AAA+-type ATPase